MPSQRINRHAIATATLLALSISGGSTHAQNFGQPQPGGARPVSGIVDQLSRGQASAGAQHASYSNNMRAGSREMDGGFYPRDLRGESGESVVALRPQPMSVRQANFESDSTADAMFNREETASRSRQELDRLNAQQHYQSFIDRENSQPEEKKSETSDLMTRIGLNLVFVLALGTGAILMFRQFQKAKGTARSQTPADLDGLKIDQVLQVTRGVSLYLVDSLTSKILVAVDAGGIKSVNVLPSRFEDELEDPDAFSRQRDSIAARSGGDRPRSGSRRGVDKTSSSDIDENLIKLLLTKSKGAA